MCYLITAATRMTPTMCNGKLRSGVPPVRSKVGSTQRNTESWAARAEIFEKLVWKDMIKQTNQTRSYSHLGRVPSLVLARVNLMQFSTWCVLESGREHIGMKKVYFWAAPQRPWIMTPTAGTCGGIADGERWGLRKGKAASTFGYLDFGTLV